MKTKLSKFYHLLYKRHFYGWTSPLRVLPDFIVIGVVRGGTTSLFENLSKHPCIYSSSYDELGFFDSNFELGLNWYRSLFPTIFRKKISELRKKCFMTYDVTPFYIWNPLVTQRIHDIFPKIKLIAILRNPIDRAYSNYFLGVRSGTENLSFEEAIGKEIELLGKESLSDQAIYQRPRSYITKGFYAHQLKPWFEIFRKEQLLILQTEKFATDSSSIFFEIFDFLQLPRHTIHEFKKMNVAKYPPMKEETRMFLKEYYRKYNDDLYALLGKSFDWN